MTWIRVDEGLPDSPKVRAFAEELRLAPEAAIGLLVALWLRVGKATTRGHVADVPDSLLEDWARWRGRPGRFAQAFRARFVDARGCVNDWDEHQGPLEDEKERARERMRRARAANKTERFGERSPNDPRTLRARSAATETETETELPTTDVVGSSPAAVSPNPDAFDVPCPATEELIARGANPATWRSEVAATTAREPMPGHAHATVAQVERASADYLASLPATHAPSLKAWRAFVAAEVRRSNRDAARPRAAPPTDPAQAEWDRAFAEAERLAAAEAEADAAPPRKARRHA